MPRLNEDHVGVNVLDVGEWPTVPHGCKKGLCVLLEAAMLAAELHVGFKRRPPGRELSAGIGHMGCKSVIGRHHWLNTSSAAERASNLRGVVLGLFRSRVDGEKTARRVFVSRMS